MKRKVRTKNSEEVGDRESGEGRIFAYPAGQVQKGEGERRRKVR